MSPFTNNQLEKPCEVCGSDSRIDMIKTCWRCNVREHAYCARAVNFNLSENWLCEACETNPPKLPFCRLQEVSMASPPGHENSETRISFHAPSMAPHDDMIFAKKTGVHNDLPGEHACRRRYITSPRKIKVILPEEVRKLQSRPIEEMPSCKSKSIGRSSQFLKSTLPNLPSKAKVDHHERPPGLNPTPRSGCPRSSFVHNKKRIATLTENKGLKGMDGMRSSRPTNEARVYSAKTRNSPKRVTGICVTKRKRAFRTSLHSHLPADERIHSQQLKKHNGEEQQKKTLLAAEIEFSGPDMEKALRWASSAPSLSKYSSDIKSGRPPSRVEEQLNSVDLAAVQNILPDLRCCVPYFPALFAIWKGQFILPDIACLGHHRGVFRAFPPSRLRCKLYELLSQMPKSLQLELIPRCKIWSDLFQDGCPNLLDVGLYFYPADPIDRSILNSYRLLELMESQDFLLRSYFYGAELFILTSKQLQVDARIFHIGLKNECFLWGVFRKSIRLPHLDISTLKQSMDGLFNECNNNVTDMDVDTVGVIDVDLLRKSSTGAQWSCKDTACGGTCQHVEPLKNCQEEAVDVVMGPIAACSTLLQPKIASGKESSSMEKHEKFIMCEEEKQASLGNKNSLQGDKSSGRLPLPSSKQPITVSTQAQDCLSSDPYCTEKIPNLPPKVNVLKNFSSPSSSAVGVPKGNLGPAGNKVKARDFAPEKAETVAVPMCDLAPYEVKVEAQVSSSEKVDCTRVSPAGVTVKAQDFAPEKAETIAVSTWNQASLKVKVEAQDSSSEKADCTRVSPKLASKLGKQNGCSPALVNFVKLNTCSVSKGSLGHSGAGGIVRDSSGKWIFGYVRNLGDSNSLRAELWALFEGLILVWDEGFRKVFVECESYPACESLKGAPSVDDPNRNILQGCKDLLLRDWTCHVNYSSEGSMQASWMASHLENLDLGQLVIFESPPLGLAQADNVIDGT